MRVKTGRPNTVTGRRKKGRDWVPVDPRYAVNSLGLAAAASRTRTSVRHRGPQKSTLWEG